MEWSMKTYTTAILALTVFFLFADQNLLAPNLSTIAKEFHFNDEQRDTYLGGYIAFGFFIVGGPVALIVGYLTDILHRCRLFGVVVGFGALASLSTFTAQDFTQLLTCRVLTGISIGGATPIIFSLLGDLYPDSQRIYVSTVLGVAMGSGVTSGQFVSGMVSPVLGWRTPFLLMSLPAIACALLVLSTVEEPRRGDQEQAMRRLRERQRSSETLVGGHAEILSVRHGGALPAALSLSSSSTVASDESLRGAEKEKERETERETVSERFEETQIEEQVTTATATAAVTAGEEREAAALDYAERIEWAKVVRLFRTRSAALIFLQGLPGCLPWGMIIVFLNDFFSHDRGLSVQAATAAMTSFGLGGLAGQLGGGALGQRLYNEDPRLQTLLMGLSTALSVFPMLYLLNASDVRGAGFFLVAFFAGLVLNMNGPNVKAVLQNVCVPEIRGTAFAVFTLTDDIGKGLGPAFVVLLIRACGGNRRQAFNIVVQFWVLCGCMLLALSLTVVEDERRAQEHVHRSLLRTIVTRFESYQSTGCCPAFDNFDSTYATLCEAESKTSSSEACPIRNPLLPPAQKISDVDVA